MGSLIDMLDALRGLMRGAFVVLLVAAAVLALVAWAARSKRLSPFTPLGRFSRKVIDPLLAPVDRMILRAGGTGTATPWWALLFVFFLGAAAIFLVTALRNGLVDMNRATSRGVGGLFRLAISWTFAALQIALLVRVLTSWLGGTFSWFGRLAFRLTEWFLAPLRNVLPPMAGFDVSPLIAWFLLSIVQGIVLSAV
jgi:YggT family protein